MYSRFLSWSFSMKPVRGMAFLCQTWCPMLSKYLKQSTTWLWLVTNWSQRRQMRWVHSLTFWSCLKYYFGKQDTYTILDWLLKKIMEILRPLFQYWQWTPVTYANIVGRWNNTINNYSSPLGWKFIPKYIVMQKYFIVLSSNNGTLQGSIDGQ